METSGKNESVIDNETPETMDTTEEQPEEDGDSSSDDLSDGDENDQKITELDAKIKENPYLYDAHLELLKLLRKEGELEKLRTARKQMSAIFPLTEELWLEWLEDEIHMSSSDIDREAITKLFETAVNDYLSVAVWLEYVQFSIGGMGEPDGVAKIRNVFERALTAAGLHVTKGASLWEAYREFETAILSGLQPPLGAILTAEKQEQITVQTNRISSIFRRQLSIPLNDMEDTYEEYKEWSNNEMDQNTEQVYKKAKEKFKKMNKYETALISSDHPHLEAYQSYIDFELSNKEPPRIQCIFERAVQENCLIPNLWLQYTKYLDTQLKVKPVILSVYERASRNCPWSVDIWLGYVRALERHHEPHEKVKGTFEHALGAGLTLSSDFLQLWTAYCDNLRRRIQWPEDHASELEDLRSTFERAVEHLSQYFGQEGDPMCSLQQYWARIEAKFCKNIVKAREIWRDIMTAGHGNEAGMWLLYYNLERSYGDSKHCRQVFQRAVNSVSDWPESVCEAYLQFEREEGTLEQYDLALAKCEAQLQRVNERRIKAAEKEGEFTEHKKPHKTAKKPGKETMSQRPNSGKTTVQTNKRKFESSDKGFKVPAAPMQSSQTSETTGPPVKKAKQDEHLPEPAKYDPTKTDQTVFVSNLSFNLEEDRIREIFSKFGDIDEIRLVKTFKGKSKGYAYVQFSSMLPVEAALKLDRTPVDGRPMYVSPCQKDNATTTAKDKFKVIHHKEFLQTGFKEQGRVVNVMCVDDKALKNYSTSLEKNKLFIKNLPTTTSKEAVETIFSQHGKLTEVRLVTYRSGAPKGFAYVQFESEKDAKQAVLKTDGLQIGDHQISVAISNPPARRAPQGQTSFQPSLGGGKKETQEHGKARTQVSLVPRILQKAPAATNKPNVPAKKSNQDFRDMLLKK